MVEKDSQKDGPTDPDRQKYVQAEGLQEDRRRFSGGQAKDLQVNRQKVCRWTDRRFAGGQAKDCR